MRKSQKYGVLLTGLLLAVVIIIFSSCDTEPPVTPVLPDVVGCSVTGDIIVSYTSKKGNIQKNIDSNFPRSQFQIGTYSDMAGHSYDIVISVFFDSTLKAPYSIPVVAANDSIKFNQAWIVFVMDIKAKNRRDFWADSGTVYIDSLSLGNNRNFVKARYNCTATERTTQKTIQITNGWANIDRKF